MWSALKTGQALRMLCVVGFDERIPGVLSCLSLASPGETGCAQLLGGRLNHYFDLQEGSIPMRRQYLWIVMGISMFFGGASVMAEDAKLEVGSPAPEFSSFDDTGNTWKSTDHVGKKIVVVYFYPADLTGGCTKQACGFRDDMAKLQAAGVEVVGVSGDSVDNHRIFKQDQKLNFTLLADETGEVAQAFGVPVDIAEKVAKVKTSDGKEISLTRKATARRWTFIIGQDGKIAYKNSMVAAAEDSRTIAAEVAKLK